MDSNLEGNIHYVATRDEGWQIVENNQRYWLSNCGCREQRGECARSRIDVCLFFHAPESGTGSALHEVSRKDVIELFAEAKEKHLVVRPFRDDNDRNKVAGICFCCDDCCGYFLNPDEKCDKGQYRETTDFDNCTHCGECVEVCYFGARCMVDGDLVVAVDQCYGCGLCADVCPTDCIRMAVRDELLSKKKKEV